MFELNRIIRPNVAKMKAYSSARSESDGSGELFLDANESPFGNGINRYPESDPWRLRKALAKEKGLDPDQVLLCNGSDEAIDLLMRAFARPGLDRVASLEPSYGMYPILAKLNDLEYLGLPSSNEFDLQTAHVEHFLNTTNLPLIFLCSPNNPNGDLIDRGQVESLLQQFTGLVVVDEAYIDFCPEASLITGLSKYPNLVILQTFSKARAAAGIRLGMLYASPEIVTILKRIKAPYNISRLNQEAALKVLDERKWPDQIARLNESREDLIQFLKAWPPVDKVYPSKANFILFTSPRSAEIYSYLRSRGIIIRDRGKQVQNALRISIGKEEEMEQLKSALRQFV